MTALSGCEVPFAGLGGDQAQQAAAVPVQQAEQQPSAANDSSTEQAASTEQNGQTEAGKEKTESTSQNKPTEATAADQPDDDTANAAPQMVTNPDSITVLINKQFSLAPDYKPADLVYPDVPFLFQDKIEKRMMRQEAAKALEEMFAGAKRDGVLLAGVSAYRSYNTQKSLFAHYVKKDGEEKAKMYSAVPGASEHETGLSIDVSGIDGRCAAEDCFAGSSEALWLDQHAAEYGFIIRYPQGKEAITGYEYEPWHIRYVGKEIAQKIKEQNLTLEEYLGQTPSNGPRN
nr:M15 family metallopeptidase [Brevibacillus fulvus]